jgi:hypothetical protein
LLIGVVHLFRSAWISCRPLVTRQHATLVCPRRHLDAVADMFVDIVEIIVIYRRKDIRAERAFFPCNVGERIDRPSLALSSRLG